MLDESEGLAGSPATKEQATVSPPFAAVTVTLAPGIRLLTEMNGLNTFVIASLDDAPESDAADSATLGGPNTVHESEVELAFPASSVAVTLNE